MNGGASPAASGAASASIPPLPPRLMVPPWPPWPPPELLDAVGPPAPVVLLLACGGSPELHASIHTTSASAVEHATNRPLFMAPAYMKGLSRLPRDAPEG